MSKAPTPAQLLTVLKRWHVPYVEVKRDGVSWRDHDRPGSWGDMNGVLVHHTGPYGSVQGMLVMLWNGRSDLPGPLCQVATSPSGKLYLMGWGRANHAGKGAANVLDALIEERPLPTPGPDAIDGNARLYGNELIHPGNTSPYPNAQIETAVRFAAAICDFHGWNHRSVLQHKEWTRRKPDTSWRGDWRAEVARALKDGPERYGYPTSAPAPAPAPAPIVQPEPVVQQQSAPAAVMVLYRKPSDPAAFQLIEGTTLRWVQKAEADEMRARGTHLLILTVPDSDPLWRLSKAS